MFMKNRDDERYKCVEMHCQNIDNQGERSCYQKKHTWRGTKIQFMIVIGQKRKTETPKST
jgi:hypothetical protein